MAGGKDEAQLGIGFAQLGVDASEDFFFAGMGAAAEEDFVAAVPAGFVPPLVDVFFLGGVAGVDRFHFRDIVLDAAEIKDGFGRETGLGEARDLGGILRKNEVDVGEERADNAAELAVALLAFIAEAGVDEIDRDVAALGAPEVIGPDFGFDEDKEPGADQLEGVDDAPEEIDGVIDDDGLVVGEPLVGERVAGAGGGGDDDANVGLHFAEAKENDAGDFDFTDADGVDPDIGAGGELFADFPGVETEALAELREEFSPAPEAEQKEKSRDEEERHEADVVHDLHDEFEKGSHARGWA